MLSCASGEEARPSYDFECRSISFAVELLSVGVDILRQCAPLEIVMCPAAASAVRLSQG